MGRQDSNEGTIGIDSIRIGGMKLDNLPIAEGANAKQQWAGIQEADKANTIVNISAKYPKQSVAWVTGAILEAEDTIRRVRDLMVRQQTMINEYIGHISLCEHRDREIAKTDDVDKIKALRLQYPPYNVDAMNVQIRLCKEAIERSNTVIDKEHDSIFELKELRSQCELRDSELKPYGVIVK